MLIAKNGKLNAIFEKYLSNVDKDDMNKVFEFLIEAFGEEADAVQEGDSNTYFVGLDEYEIIRELWDTIDLIYDIHYAISGKRAIWKED